MKDKFGAYLQANDFVVYNQCVVGRVVNPQDVNYPVINFTRLSAYNSPYGPSIKAKVGILVENQYGRRTVVYNSNKIIRMSGLPREVMDKFK